MEIQDIIKQLTKTKEEIYSCVCTVAEINEAERTISVKPNNGNADVFDVRLQTVISGIIGLVIFPALNSEVVINFISKELAFVALFSEIEKIELKIGSMSVFVDASNMNLASENIDVIATNTELSSDNIKMNASDVQIVSTNFEVQGGTKIKLTAPLTEIISNAINLTGAVTVAGTLSVSGAIAAAGPVAMTGTVQLGTGSNGGIPKSSALVTEINKLKTDFQNLKAKFNSWTPVTHDGGAALKTQLSSWTPNTTPITAPSISNPNATQ